MRKNSIRRRSPPVSWNWGRPFLRYPTAKIARALPLGRDAGLIRQFGRKETFAAGFADVCYARVVSTGCCNTRLKFLCWGLILQGLSRPLVELASDCAQLCLAKARYINAFREVLAKKSIGVFITPSLPRIARQAIA